ncbi:uncharacterized protein LOC122422015 [Cervus canadensis]|uniref:uncharacterized protein LOC122422015 n=1 Tax=Cervus canadensis TaxID=1574408 RepID=UPI001CA30E7A|nr:uncharacterized protein LOC122422015 [Cervus canadensis]
MPGGALGFPTDLVLYPRAMLCASPRPVPLPGQGSRPGSHCFLPWRHSSSRAILVLAPDPVGCPWCELVLGPHLLDEDRPLPPLPAQGTLMLRNPCLDLGGSHQWKVLVEDEKERMREVRVRFPLSLCFGQRPVHPGSGQLSSIAGDGQEPHPLRCQPEAWRIHAPATAPSGSVPPQELTCCGDCPLGFSRHLTSLPATGAGDGPYLGRRRRRGPGAHGFAGLGRPRWETPAAPSRPDPRRSQRPPRRRHWAGASRGPAGGRASRARVTLYLRCPRRARPPTPLTPAPEPGLACGAHPGRKSRSSASDRGHSGCAPAARSLGETFWCLLYRQAAGRGELPKMRDVSGEIHQCTPGQIDVSPLLPVNVSFGFLPRSGKSRLNLACALSPAFKGYIFWERAQTLPG